MNNILVIVCLCLMLTGCIGPTLFQIGGYKVTTGSIVTMPIKKKVIEELKNEEQND